MRLYSKFIVWAALNIVWLATLLGALLAWGVLRADGRFPHAIFQGGINSAMQMVAVNLQYKSVGMWERVLEQYGRSYGIKFMIHSLDPEDPIPGTPEFPQEVLDTAWRIPRPRMELCPGPQDSVPIDERMEIESGFLPSLNALFLKSGGEYWYGRPAIIPDDIYELHYVLLAAVSPSLTGNGMFFRVGEALGLVALCLVLSFLWWWPFVLYITRPMERITRKAEDVAAGNFSLTENEQGAEQPLFSLSRKDEIGRLACALNSMSGQLIRQMCGQRRFIRHIAHELGAPLARAKFGLVVLEDRLDGENAWRAGQVMEEVEQVTELVEDVLAYLRSEGLPRRPRLEAFTPGESIRKLVSEEARGVPVELRLPSDLPPILADRECFQRALGNALRNAVRYASAYGPVSVSAETRDRYLLVRVADHGPGVSPGELAHLTEPFFRGRSAESHPGGSGLGLSIVKYCVDSCRGRLEFSNLTPQGFRVDLFFPLDETDH